MISKEDRPSLESLRGQASALTVAGSETTATALSGITYYLCRNGRVYQSLAREVRGAFENYKDINGRSADTLPYLKAVIDEGLRLYPPIPIGLPRVSPGETVNRHYIPKERWIDPACKDQKLASQPFLLGSRACLGRQ